MKIIKIVVDKVPVMCNDCRFYKEKSTNDSNVFRSYCGADNYTWGFGGKTVRPNWCPLITGGEYAIKNIKEYMKMIEVLEGGNA